MNYRIGISKDYYCFIEMEIKQKILVKNFVEKFVMVKEFSEFKINYREGYMLKIQRYMEINILICFYFLFYLY